MRSAVAWLNEWCEVEGEHETETASDLDGVFHRPPPTSAWEEVWEAMVQGRCFSLAPERNIAA